MDFLRREYSLGEEIFNSVSHGTGVLLSIAGCVVIIVYCAIYADARAVVSASIYGASLILMYTMSTLYHAITNKKAKRVLRVLDHNAIFLLIAGTYTPFSLVALKGALGWTIFGVIWAAAIFGMILSSVNLRKFSKVSTVCYVAMGLAVLLAFKPLYAAIPLISFIFLLVGGVFYLAGVVFYVKKEISYMHSIWHLFVIGGTIFHYFSLFYELVKIK